MLFLTRLQGLEESYLNTSETSGSRRYNVKRNAELMKPVLQKKQKVQEEQQCAFQSKIHFICCFCLFVCLFGAVAFGLSNTEMNKSNRQSQPGRKPSSETWADHGAAGNWGEWKVMTEGGGGGGGNSRLFSPSPFLPTPSADVFRSPHALPLWVSEDERKQTKSISHDCVQHSPENGPVMQ